MRLQHSQKCWSLGARVGDLQQCSHLELVGKAISHSISIRGILSRHELILGRAYSGRHNHPTQPLNKLHEAESRR